MTRADLLKTIRSGVRGYRRTHSGDLKRSLSYWLLKLMQVNTQATLDGVWCEIRHEHYFYRVASLAVLCLDDNGVIRAGTGPPIERLVRPEEADLDVVLMAIHLGCAKYSADSTTDLIVRINSHLHDAVDSHAAPNNKVFTLLEIRDIASMAILGLEITKLNGDNDAK